MAHAIEANDNRNNVLPLVSKRVDEGHSGRVTVPVTIRQRQGEEVGKTRFIVYELLHRSSTLPPRKTIEGPQDSTQLFSSSGTITRSGSTRPQRDNTNFMAESQNLQTPTACRLHGVVESNRSVSGALFRRSVSKRQVAGQWSLWSQAGQCNKWWRYDWMDETPTVRLIIISDPLYKLPN